MRALNSLAAKCNFAMVSTDPIRGYFVAEVSTPHGWPRGRLALCFSFRECCRTGRWRGHPRIWEPLSVDQFRDGALMSQDIIYLWCPLASLDDRVDMRGDLV